MQVLRTRRAGSKARRFEISGLRGPAGGRRFPL